MSQSIYPEVTSEVARKRREAAPDQYQAFRNFSSQAFAEGELDAKTKQLIAVAAAHVTQCPYCIEGHTKQTLQAGATEQQIMEAIWVAAEMRAGAAYAHSAIALKTIQQNEPQSDES
jgi:AhpD family alkylhydroperoxidase